MDRLEGARRGDVVVDVLEHDEGVDGRVRGVAEGLTRLEQIERDGVRPFTLCEKVIIGVLAVAACSGVGGLAATAIAVNEVSGIVFVGCFSGAVGPVYAGWRLNQTRQLETQIELNRAAAEQVRHFREENDRLTATNQELEGQVRELSVQVNQLQIVQSSLTRTAAALGGTQVKEEAILAKLGELCNEDMRSVLDEMEGMKREQQELISELGVLQEKEKALMAKEISLHERNQSLSAEMKDTLDRLQRSDLQRKYQRQGKSAWREFVMLLYYSIKAEGTKTIGCEEIRRIAQAANDSAYSKWFVCEMQELVGSVYDEDMRGALYEHIRQTLGKMGSIHKISTDRCEAFRREIDERVAGVSTPQDVAFREQIEALVKRLEKPEVEEVFGFIFEDGVTTEV